MILCTASNPTFVVFSIFRESAKPNWVTHTAAQSAVCATYEVKNYRNTEAEYKEKHGVWDPMPELTMTSHYVDYNTFTMGNPMPELTLSPSHGLRI
jgi:hypothetical protein